MISWIVRSYKGMSGQKGLGWVVGADFAAGGGLYLPTGLFVASLRSASHRPRQARETKRPLTNTGVNIRPIPPI